MFEKKVNNFNYLTGAQKIDSNKQTIIFIHSAGSSAMLWEEQVKGLAEIVNTIAIDLPGHGKSKEPGMDDIKNYSQKVVQFADALKLKNLIICGLSMGGGIVQQVLIDYKSYFKAGILAGTGARLKVMPKLLEVIEQDYPRYLKILQNVAFYKKSDKKRIEHAVQITEKCSPLVTKNDFEACNKFDVMKTLNSIQVPVLVISAENDKLTPAKYGDYLQNNIKNSFREHIKSCGHHIPVERPNEFNNTVKRFLKLKTCKRERDFFAG